jgi:hypothetical protein
MCPEPKTIVFGAVEKGNMKAKLTLTVIGSRKKAEFKLLLIALIYKKHMIIISIIGDILSNYHRVSYREHD